MSLLPLGMFTEQYYMAWAMGYHTGGLKRNHGWLMLYIGACVTVAHSLLPLRSCLLWPMEALSLLIYPVMIGVEGARFPLTHWLTLCVLLLSCAVGKRTMELQERELYHQVLVERTLRAELEFELSRSRSRSRKGEAPLEEEPEDAEAPGEARDSISEPSGATSYLFGRSCAPTQVEAWLERLATVGRRERWLIDADDLQVARRQVLGRGGFASSSRAPWRAIPWL